MGEPSQPVDGPVSEVVAMFLTAMEAHDAYHLKADKYVRTITIDNLGIAAHDFGLSPDEKEALHQSGERGAHEFLDHWDFARYKELYRSGCPVPPRRTRVLPAADWPAPVR